ncbi:hypothetical protein PRIEUP_LOCUS14793 [Pristimantis euphronides]
MDRAVLLLPFILSSLVSTTFSLSCIECSGEGGKPCQGFLVTCLTDFDVCVATLESEIKDGNEMTKYRQYCGKSSMCSYIGSLTTDHGEKKISSSCCFTSSCVPVIPKLPTVKSEKNGLSCKACSTEKAASCDPIECTGEENKCVSITSTTKAGQTPSTSSVSGCGTPEWCSKDREFQYVGQTTEMTFTCSKGNDLLIPGLPLLLLAALLVMKAIC